MGVFKWVFPTETELVNEFKTEFDIQSLYDADGHSFFTNSAYDMDIQMKIFLSHMDKAGTEFYDIETVEWQTFTRLQENTKGWPTYYQCESIDHLTEVTKYMCKNPASLMSGLLGEGVPYIVMLRQWDGNLKMLGGRTRASLCVLYKMNAKCMILDQEKISGDILRRMKTSFIHDRHSLTPSQREKLWNVAVRVASLEITFDEGVTQLDRVSQGCRDDLFLKTDLRMLVRKMEKYSYSYKLREV